MVCDAPSNATTAEINNPPTTVLCNISPKGQVLLMTATVWLQGRERPKKIVCLIDSGSERSFVRKGLASPDLATGRRGRRN